MQKKIPWIVGALALLIHAWFSQYNHDEIEHLHAAWMISVGHRPFADFLEQHHPTLWVLFQPLVRSVHSPHTLIFCARLFDLAVLGAFLVVLDRLVKRFCSDSTFAVLLVFASFTFTRNMILFRPDPLMNLCLYVGIWQWVIFLQDGRPARAAVAGLFFGLAVAVLQKALALAGLVAVGSLIPLWRRRRIPGALLALGCAALPVGVLFAAMRAWGIWPEFWFWNYDFNRYFYTHAALSAHFTVTLNLARSFVEDPALWLFGAAGVWLWIKKGADDVRAVLLFAMVGYLISLGFNKFPFTQYFIVVLPLWAPFAAEVFALKQRRPTRLLALGMLCILAGLGIAVSSNRGQRALHAYILSHSRSDQTIYASPPIHPVFREDASFFWYNGELIGGALAGYEAEHGPAARRWLEDRAWSERPPALVYLDPRHPTYHPYHWSEYAAAFVPADTANLLLRR